jgi:hypothetical protein
MISKLQRLTQFAAVAGALALAVPATAATASAGGGGAIVAASGSSVTKTVTIKAINPTTREIDVVDPAGTVSLIKAPASVQNFGQLKVGDKIKATYTLETEFVISEPNKPLPPNTAASVTARAAKGELPAAAVANHIVITGAVLAIDMTKHTIKLVNPKGGEVHTFTVQASERQKAMSKLKVGDYITAYLTESLLISASRA